MERVKKSPFSGAKEICNMLEKQRCAYCTFEAKQPGSTLQTPQQPSA